MKDRWRSTDQTEIMALLGCLLYTGSLHQSRVSLDVIFSPVDGNPLLRAAFSKDRFSRLLNHIMSILMTKKQYLHDKSGTNLLQYGMFGTVSMPSWQNIIIQVTMLLSIKCLCLSKDGAVLFSIYALQARQVWHKNLLGM